MEVLLVGGHKDGEYTNWPEGRDFVQFDEPRKVGPVELNSTETSVSTRVSTYLLQRVHFPDDKVVSIGAEASLSAFDCMLRVLKMYDTSKMKRELALRFIIEHQYEALRSHDKSAWINEFVEVCKDAL